jgi:hypothetical protein
MNYQKVYNQVVERAKSQNRSKKDSYYESHHIVPKCMGGSNDKNNLVLLTGREHYICHALLFMEHPTDRRIAHAFYLMCNFSNDGRRDYVTSSRLYEEAKVIYSRYRKEEQPKTLKKYWTEEKKIERSIKYSGEGNPMFGKEGSFTGKTHTPESIEKQRVKMIGYKQSADHISKIVASKIENDSYSKLSQKMKKPILNIQTGEIYNSREEASILLNCSTVTVDKKRKLGILNYINNEDN